MVSRSKPYLCKSHPDFHIPGDVDVGEGFDGDAYAKRLKDNGVDLVVFFAKCHYGHCYYYTDIGHRHPRLKSDMLAEVIRGCRAHGLGIGAYFSVFLDTQAIEHHPDWRLQATDNKVDAGFDSGNYLPVCVNSPYLDELFIPQSIEVATKYDVDEVFYDTMTGFKPCFCDNCRRLFGHPIPHSSEDPRWLKYVAWYRSHGTEKSPGTHLFGISGHVEKPGMYELPLGLPLMEVIDKVAGGVWKGRKLKGIIPGGSSTPVLLPEEAADTTLDYESMAAHKTMFGSGGIVVLDETVDIVQLVKNLIDFYHHESCGQCTPCREGLGWMLKIIKKILRREGTIDDVLLLRELCDNIEMKTVCVLSAACTMPVRSYLDKFRHEFEAYVAEAASVPASE